LLNSLVIYGTTATKFQSIKYFRPDTILPADLLQNTHKLNTITTKKQHKNLSSRARN